jgi:hypothetical protein
MSVMTSPRSGFRRTAIASWALAGPRTTPAMMILWVVTMVSQATRA